MARTEPGSAARPAATALVVVDGPAWAALLIRVLAARGFEPRRATPEVACAALAAWRYHLVVVADRSPGGDGLDTFALVRWLRGGRGAADPRTAVLVLCPALTGKGRRLLAGSGVDGLLVGPVLTERRLERAVLAACAGRRPSGGRVPPSAA